MQSQSTFEEEDLLLVNYSLKIDFFSKNHNFQNHEKENDIKLRDSILTSLLNKLCRLYVPLPLINRLKKRDEEIHLEGIKRRHPRH